LFSAGLACTPEISGIAPEPSEAVVSAPTEGADAGTPTVVVPPPSTTPVSIQGADAGSLHLQSCNFGVASSSATASSLEHFGDIAYFAGGSALPPGPYRIAYEDGCMKYGVFQDWTVHNAAYSGFWLVGGDRDDHVVRPPGTEGAFVATGAFSSYDACVAANRLVAPVLFVHRGGPLGIVLDDTPYFDNTTGPANPRWRLELTATCAP
jgi:hypothetical protein